MTNFICTEKPPPLHPFPPPSVPHTPSCDSKNMEKQRKRGRKDGKTQQTATAPSTAFQAGSPGPEQNIPCGSVLTPWCWGRMEVREPHQPSVSSYLSSFSLWLPPKQGGELIPSLFPHEEHRYSFPECRTSTLWPCVLCFPCADPESHSHFSTGLFLQALLTMASTAAVSCPGAGDDGLMDLSFPHPGS